MAVLELKDDRDGDLSGAMEGGMHHAWSALMLVVIGEVL